MSLLVALLDSAATALLRFVTGRFDMMRLLLTVSAPVLVVVLAHRFIGFSLVVLGTLLAVVLAFGFVAFMAFAGKRSGGVV